jgi:chromosome partitioning protein
MPVIVVANPKGGVGKSTLATNLAGWLARQGHAVMLGDVDRQQSARQWLALRPAALPPIQGWAGAMATWCAPPKGTTHVVLDTPAGLHGKRLDAVLKIADRVLVPLQPSLFDIQATHAFVQVLREQRRRANWRWHWWPCVREGAHPATQHLHAVPGSAGAAAAERSHHPPARHAELRAPGRPRR